MKTNNELIYFANWGQQEFTNGGHVQNFLKYLFSCSKSHTENHKTKDNFYLTLDKETNKLSKFSHVTDPKDKYNKFKNKFWNELSDETTIINDLNYVAFAIIIGDRVISNIYKKDKSDPNVLRGDLSNDIFSMVVTSYFNRDVDQYYQTVDGFIDCGKEYVYFNDATDEERLIIEKRVHKELIKQSGADNVLIAISHNDQDDSYYHIHRILKL